MREVFRSGGKRSRMDFATTNLKGASMAEKKPTQENRTDRRPDCVTEIRMGNTVLVVSGFFKKNTTATAADKMMKVLEAESQSGSGVGELA